MNKQNQMIKIINEMWKTIPYRVYYDDFNKVFPVNENKYKLRELEKQDNRIGIAKFDTKYEGISILSFMTTITDLLVGKRLSAICDKDKNGKLYIKGWAWYKSNQI